MAEAKWAPELKKTRQRRLVLETLERAEGPVAATDITARLAQAGTPVWLSTVYRVLDTFVEHGMLQKTTVLESGAAVYELCGSHRHYAVCVVCRKIIPLHGCPLDSFRPELGERFHITGHRLQIYGVCGGCEKNQ